MTTTNTVAESPLRALRADMDAQARMQAYSAEWHEQKPNREPEYDTWMHQHVVLAYGHFLRRTDAFDLARHLGDAEFFNDLLEALPWCGDDLEPEDLENAVRSIQAYEHESADTISDPAQVQLPWDEQQAHAALAA